MKVIYNGNKFDRVECFIFITWFTGFLFSPKNVVIHLNQHL